MTTWPTSEPDVADLGRPVDCGAARLGVSGVPRDHAPLFDHPVVGVGIEEVRRHPLPLSVVQTLERMGRRNEEQWHVGRRCEAGSGPHPSEGTPQKGFDKRTYVRYDGIVYETLVAELMDSDDGDLTARLRDLELEVRRLAAVQSAVIGEVDRRKSFREDGHRSLSGYLKANLNWSSSQVRASRRCVAACSALGGVGDALADGHVGVAQVEEMGRLAANPRVRDQIPSVRAELLDAAEQLSYDDFRVVTRMWESKVDAEGAFDPARLEHRSATVTANDGELFVDVRGGTATGADEVVTIFDRFVQAEFEADVAERDRQHGPNAPEALLARTGRQRRYDAFVAMVRAANDALDRGVEPTPLPMMVHVVVSQYDFEHALANDGLITEPTDLSVPDLLDRRQHTLAGVPVGDDEVVRAAIHGHVRRAVIDSHGVVTDYGRAQRLFTGPIRLAAQLMGHHCSHPGCEVSTRNCQIDHVDEWDRDGGRTSIANAGLECSAHNRYKHRAGLTRQRIGPRQILTLRADGSPMTPVGQRPPPGVEQLPEAG